MELGAQEVHIIGDSQLELQKQNRGIYMQQLIASSLLYYFHSIVRFFSLFGFWIRA